MYVFVWKVANIYGQKTLVEVGSSVLNLKLVLTVKGLNDWHLYLFRVAQSSNKVLINTVEPLVGFGETMATKLHAEKKTGFFLAIKKCLHQIEVACIVMSKLAAMAMSNMVKDILLYFCLSDKRNITSF